MPFTEKELEKLINDVEKEFTSHLVKAEENFSLAKSEEATLAKAEDEKKPEEKEEPKKEEHKEEKPEHKEMEEKKPEVESLAAAPKEGEDHCDYDEEDMGHMRKMYASMSKGELKAHHDCIADLAKCGGIEAAPPGKLPGKEAPDSHSHPDVQKSEDGFIKPSEPCGSPGAKSPASNANGDKINAGLKKAEHSRENGGKIEASAPKGSPGPKSPASKAEGVQMEKSESTSELELLKGEIATAHAKAETLQKNLDAVSAFLTKLVEKKVAPQGKAITSLDVIAKSESTQEDKTPTKSEIDAALSRKSQDPKLEKSDRDAINDYYLGSKNIEKISHLLK